MTFSRVIVGLVSGIAASACVALIASSAAACSYDQASRPFIDAPRVVQGVPDLEVMSYDSASVGDRPCARGRIHVYDGSSDSRVGANAAGRVDPGTIWFDRSAGGEPPDRLASDSPRSHASRTATNSADQMLALPGARQIDAAWGTNTYRHGGTMSTIEHINYRHAWNSGFKGVSRFADGTSARQIQGLVDDALRFGAVSPNGTNGYSVIWNTGRNVGVDASGASASGLQVYVRDGIIQSAFPVAAP